MYTGKTVGVSLLAMSAKHSFVHIYI
ncbi:hypothetical protein EMIT0P265_10855 [Pseudomonas zeae]